MIGTGRKGLTLDVAGREREGLLFVPRAGEMLFRLKKPDAGPLRGPSRGFTQTS